MEKYRNFAIGVGSNLHLRQFGSLMQTAQRRQPDRGRH